MALISRGSGFLRAGLPLVSQKNFAYWHADWKPKPFPTTPAQREAAAKKYGLLPEDYETYEPDGNCPGDYPKLEPFNELHRDPYDHYDYGQLKRNYNEPIPWYWDFFGPMGHDNYRQQLRYNEPRWRTLTKFIAPVLVIGPLFYLGDMYKLFQPMMPKQYPLDGRENYTFEPASE